MNIDQLTAKAEIDLANVDAAADRRAVLRAFADEVLERVADRLEDVALRSARGRAGALFGAAKIARSMKRPA